MSLRFFAAKKDRISIVVCHCESLVRLGFTAICYDVEKLYGEEHEIYGWVLLWAGSIRGRR